MKFVGYLMSQDGILTTTIAGTSYLVNKSHVNYNALIKAWKENNPAEFVKLYNVSATINKSFFGSGVSVVNGEIFYNGELVDHSICDRIIQHLKEGYPVQYLVNFLSKLMSNQSRNSLRQSFNFLQQKNLPICEDGDFLAYKTVREDYLDKYTGTISNRVGAIIDWRHKRNQISDDPSRHCDQGLHVGALSYAGPGGWYNRAGDKVVIVKVNPADIVCVPNDHSFAKMRVCRYEVIADYVAPLTNAVYNAQPSTWSYDEVEEDEIDDEEFFDDEVEVSDLLFGDRVEFYYHGKKRRIEVDGYDDDLGILTGILLPGDSSYLSGQSDEQFRNFRSGDISEMKLLYS